MCLEWCSGYINTVFKIINFLLCVSIIAFGKFNAKPELIPFTENINTLTNPKFKTIRNIKIKPLTPKNDYDKEEQYVSNQIKILDNQLLKKIIFKC